MTRYAWPRSNCLTSCDMTMRTVRWLGCDFPGCIRRFDTEHQRAVTERHRVRDIRDAAALAGWIRTDNHEDLCMVHADLHRNRPAQPTLFPEEDHDPSVPT